MAIRIFCIKRESQTDPSKYESISLFGWENESTGASSRITPKDLSDWIQDKKGLAYALDANGGKEFVGVRKNQVGAAYVQTYSDGKWTDTLLSLPEC
jgi:Protein of unknown function (DUF3892)